MSNPLIKLLSDVSTQMKGDKGDPGQDGYTPVKGVDYFDGEKGDPGIPGKDGRDGKPGKDGRDGVDGRPGLDGKDGTDGINPDPLEVVQLIKELKGDARIDISNIRNGEQLLRGIGKKGTGYKLDDMRWHGAGVTQITAGTGISISPSSGTGNVTVSSTGTPGGADTQIQYNNNGAFGGDANLFWLKDDQQFHMNGNFYFDSSGSINSAADLTISAADHGLGTGPGSPVQVVAGDGGGVSGNGGDVEFDAGNAGGGNSNGGNVAFIPGAKSGGGTAGSLQIYDPGTGFIASFDTSVLGANKTFTFPNQTGVFSTVTSGSGVPGSTPSALGQIYIDTSGAKVYASTGTTNSADWKILN